MRVILVVFVIFYMSVSAISKSQQTTAALKMDIGKGSSITYKIISSTGNTFGYDIFVNGVLNIHQSTIPGMPGKNGFKTKEDTIKVVEYIIEKMKKGIMPPTIGSNEMRKLKVI